MWRKIISLISAKTIAKYLPEILAFVLTKALAFIIERQPNKVEKVKEFASDFAVAIAATVAAAEDNKFDVAEMKDLQKKWTDVFVL